MTETNEEFLKRFESELCVICRGNSPVDRERLLILARRGAVAQIDEVRNEAAFDIEYNMDVHRAMILIQEAMKDITPEPSEPCIGGFEMGDMTKAALGKDSP